MSERTRARGAQKEQRRLEERTQRGRRSAAVRGLRCSLRYSTRPPPLLDPPAPNPKPSPSSLNSQARSPLPAPPACPPAPQRARARARRAEAQRRAGARGRGSYVESGDIARDFGMLPASRQAQPAPPAAGAGAGAVVWADELEVWAPPGCGARVRARGEHVYWTHSRRRAGRAGGVRHGRRSGADPRRFGAPRRR